MSQPMPEHTVELDTRVDAVVTALLERVDLSMDDPSDGRYTLTFRVEACEKGVLEADERMVVLVRANGPRLFRVGAQHRVRAVRVGPSWRAEVEPLLV